MALAAATNSKVDLERYSVKGDVRMCKLFEEIRDEGLSQGKIQATIEMCQEFGVSKDATIEKLIQKFKISHSVASEQIAQYWELSP